MLRFHWEPAAAAAAEASSRDEDERMARIAKGANNSLSTKFDSVMSAIR